MQNDRELWLNRAAAIIAAGRFAPKGYAVPPIRVSVGFPSKSATSRKSRRIGECWSPEASADNVAQIFISPVLADSVRVADVLAHEMVHAAVGNDAGHRAPFRRCALAIGLVGKMNATVASAEFAEWLARMIVLAIGEYPHAELRPATNEKKQGTRMIKCTCAACGYVARTTAVWLEMMGAPLCPCNGEQMAV